MTQLSAIFTRFCYIIPSCTHDKNMANVFSRIKSSGVKANIADEEKQGKVEEY